MDGREDLQPLTLYVRCPLDHRADHPVEKHCLVMGSFCLVGESGATRPVFTGKEHPLGRTQNDPKRCYHT